MTVMAARGLSALIFPQISQPNELDILSSEPKDKEFYETAFSFADRHEQKKIGGVIGLIVPHHLLAADIIAQAYDSIIDEPDLIILAGPNHFNAGNAQIITTAKDWQTPYGRLPADRESAEKIAGRDVVIDNDAFGNEHSITSQTAFIRRTFPQAAVLPLIFKSTASGPAIDTFAQRLFSETKDKNILFIASLDFSHDQPLDQTLVNDEFSRQQIEEMNFDNLEKIQVDSRPVLRLMMQYASMQNASFHLLNNTNSALLSDQTAQPNVTSYISGIYRKDIDTATIGSNNAPEPIKFLFVGDIMLDRHVGEKIASKGFDYLFAGLAKDKFFDGYDVIGANLEGAVTDEGRHYKPDNAYDFAFAPGLIDGLKAYNFNFFSVANNHLADQGERGIIETRANLDKSGFVFSGCQDAQVGECSGTTTRVRDKNIALLSFSQVYKALDRDKMAGIVKEAASTSDIVVVNIHWGLEYEHQFSRSQQEIGRALVDAGADAIIGHHPHVVQGMEIYKNKPIFYSLGNFIFDQYFSADTQEELALGISLADDQMNINLYPLRSISSQPSLSTATEKEVFLKKFISWSQPHEIISEQANDGSIAITY